MIKAKLFSYSDTNTYYRKYGITPDRHFDRLREKYGTDVAVGIVDRNMIKALECKRKRDIEKEKERQRILESECPFGNG